MSRLKLALVFVGVAVVLFLSYAEQKRFNVINGPLRVYYPIFTGTAGDQVQELEKSLVSHPSFQKAYLTQAIASFDPPIQGSAEAMIMGDLHLMLSNRLTGNERDAELKLALHSYCKSLTMNETPRAGIRARLVMQALSQKSEQCFMGCCNSTYLQWAFPDRFLMATAIQVNTLLNNSSAPTR